MDSFHLESGSRLTRFDAAYIVILVRRNDS